MMKKFVGLLAFAGLTACSAGYDAFQYEITERSSSVVKVQTHKHMLNLPPDQVARAHTHMHLMARNVCREFGKNNAVYQRDRNYTTGAYYSWHERIYRCS